MGTELIGLEAAINKAIMTIGNLIKESSGILMLNVQGFEPCDVRVLMTKEKFVEEFGEEEWKITRLDNKLHAQIERNGVTYSTVFS